MDRSIEPLDGDAPDVLISGRDSADMMSDVGSDMCVVPDQLPVVVSEETVVEDAEMENFVLVPEVCPVVSMTSAAELPFGPVLSEVYSPVVLAGGGCGCCGIPPGSVRYSASVCPVGGRVRYSASVCPASRRK